MDPLDRFRAEMNQRLERIEDKLDEIQKDMGRHTHSGYVTFPWFIGTLITLASLAIGLAV